MRPIFREDLDQVDAGVGNLWQQLAGSHLFITGGTGFVGQWLLATLCHAIDTRKIDCRVTVLTRDARAFTQRNPELALHAAVELIEGDVIDFRFPEGRYSHAIHAAADVVNPVAPRATFDTCTEGTKRVLDFAAQAGVAHLMLLSSGAVYGRQPPQIDAVSEDYEGAPDSLAEGSAYGLGKRAAEWLTVEAAKRTGMHSVIARGFAFVGPYLPLDRHFAIGNFIRDAMQGRTIIVQGDGTPLRSYLYAADMAEWLWTVLLAGKNGSAYNVGGEQAISIADLAREVASALGSSTVVEVRGTPVAGAVPARYVPAIRKAQQDLGLTVRTALPDAIRKTAAWYRPAGGK
jgi:nucleoside-diphosphate-sugar epimerase